MSSFVQRVFSGVQPTGGLHIGNYLGAIKRFAPLQDDHECIYCVVDLHAITLWQDPSKLTEECYDIVAAFLASGIDPKRSIIFMQSHVPAHTEIAWVFNCVCRIGWLNRMTQFKSKAGKHREKASVGLYAYPNLMAADVLTYHATHVPVGDDQKQHLEMMRDLAQKFNTDFAPRLKEFGFGDQFFPLVEPLITGAATRVMSLRDGTQKMSKSDPSEMTRLQISDDDDALAMKIRKAKTDPLPIPSSMEELRNRPEAENLISIYAALRDCDKESVLRDFSGKDFATFKKSMTEVVVETFGAVAREFRRLRKEKGEFERILTDGAERARAISEPIVRDCYKIIGFIPGR